MCPDAKTFHLTTVESAVLAGLAAEMRHPGVIAEHVRRERSPHNVRGVWGKMVARDRYRLSSHDANLRYFLRSSA